MKLRKIEPAELLRESRERLRVIADKDAVEVRRPKEIKCADCGMILGSLLVYPNNHHANAAHVMNYSATYVAEHSFRCPPCVYERSANRKAALRSS